MLHVICIKKRKTRSFYYLQIPLPLIHNFIKFTKGMQINFSNFCIIWFYFYFLKRFYLFNFRERGKEGERGEKHQCVVASHAPPTGDLACNPGIRLTGNQTGNPLVRRPGINPLSHTSQGGMQFFRACLKMG